MFQDLLAINRADMRPRGKHGDDDLSLGDRLSDRCGGLAACAYGPLDRSRRKVESADLVLGPGLIGGHATAHVPQSNKGDTRHLVFPANANRASWARLLSLVLFGVLQRAGLRNL
jgi:hypothetical protein